MIDIKKFSKNFDIEKYLSKNNISYHSYENSEEIILDRCPYCNGINKSNKVKKDKFYLSREKKLFTCFLCGETGNLVKFLSKVENKTIKEIINTYLYNNRQMILPSRLNRSGIILQEKSSINQEDQSLPPIDLPDSFKKLIPFSEENLEAYKYIEERGFLDKEIIEELDIRFCKYYSYRENGFFKVIKNRIVFPIYQNNICIGWQARDITNKSKIKYLISKNFKKNLILYNYDKIVNTHKLILVEGIIDLVKCPIDNTTCLFGKSVSDAQFRLILNMPNLKEIVIAIDPEEDYSRGKIFNMFNQFFNVKFCILPLGEDPGSQNREQMLNYLNNSTNNSNKILLKKII